MLFGEGPQIKNIAADLNKLFRQGSLLNQSGQTVEGDSTADQGTSDLLAARDPVIQEISVGMSGEQSARYTVSGIPPLSLPNSLGKPLKAWEVDVLPYQEGTGDPAPDNVRPIHGTDRVTVWTAGKNLYGGTFNEFYPLHFDTDMAVIASASAPVTTGLTPQISFYDVNQTRIDYWGMTTNASAVSGRIASIAFTLPKESYYIKFLGAECNEYMLEFGNANTEYTPFTVAPSQTVLTLPQTVYTGTIGSEGGESRSAMVDMGDMTWDRDGSAGRFYSSSIRTLVKAGSDADGYDNAFAETYKAQNVASLSFLSDYCMSVDTSGNVQLYDSSKAGMTGVDLKTALTGIKMVYKLATPVQFVLSAPDIPTPRGTATTWATAEDGTVDGMEVTYVGKA